MSRNELEEYYADIWWLFGVEYSNEHVEVLVKKMVRELRIPVEEKSDLDNNDW
jgi:hypothetical protein